MSSSSGHLSLTFDEFPTPTFEAWRAQAEATLAGVPFGEKLVTRTGEGIDIQPIYRREDLAGISNLDTLPGQPPFVRGTRAENSWEIAQEIPYGFPKEFNEALRNDLERGQTAVNITLDQATRHGLDPDLATPGEAGLCGVSITTAGDFARLLDGVDVEKTPLFIQGGSAALPIYALLLAHFRLAKKNPATLQGALEHDPLGELVSDGSLPHSFKQAFDQMALVTRRAIRETPKFATIAVRARATHDAGGNAVQELAFALAMGVEYLREMESRGLGVNDTAPRIRFAFSIGADFSMAIAKFRAARLLWARVVSASGGGVESQKMRIHARTSLWNRSTLDPYVNMLRGTTEAFAAVAAGYDSLHVGAFDEVVRPPDEFSRRIARNTQIILRDECHFDHVADPAGGSYYVEVLTDRLARKAWTLFQQVEKEGGMAQALANNFPQKLVNETAAKKIEAVAQRRSSLIGVNVYANSREQPPATPDLEPDARRKKRAAYAADHRASPGQAAQAAVMARLGQILESAPDQIAGAAIEAAAEGATLGELSRTLRARDGAAPKVAPLPVRRGAEPFEKLRTALAAAGKPKVFLVNMGPLRQYKLRADFATGFFQAGGFDVLENRGFSTVEAAAEAAQKSGAPVVVICSTDETYPELVPPLVRRIKGARPRCVVVLAGCLKERVGAFKAAGVDEFIHVRANCYETLRAIAGKIGVNL